MTKAPTSLLALAVALVISLVGARAAESEYAPRNIKETYDKSAKYCYFQSLCPYSPEMRKLIEQAISKDRSAQYRLGLTLLTGDGLPRDRDAGLAWVVLAAEQGEAAAARYVAGRLRNGDAIEIDETKVAEARKPQAAPAISKRARVVADDHRGPRRSRTRRKAAHAC